MTLGELLNAANDGYPDGFLAAYYDPATGAQRSGGGDGLAEFVVQELADTYDRGADSREQLEEAMRVIDRAISELEAVRAALLRYWTAGD